MTSPTRLRVQGPVALDALELRDRIASGAMRAIDLARACLDQTQAVDGIVRAWAWLDEGHVVAEAERLDTLHRKGRALGPLHGLPVGVKDIIDTAGIPTANGTSLDRGRVPAADAAVVRRLKAAGAYVFGKTVTAELAFLHPGPTTNPHDPSRTPGGSSQGSAAAVAAGMVPLAIGTQTGGSVIRPAAFCGITGFKPSFGLIPRTGILAQSPSLDTVGVFAATPGAATLIAAVLAGKDPEDQSAMPSLTKTLLSVALSEPPARPMLAIVTHLPGAELDVDMLSAMESLSSALRNDAFRADLPSAFAQAAERRETINLVEMVECYHSYERRGHAAVSGVLRDAMDRGRAISAQDYRLALNEAQVLWATLDSLLSRCDAIICPSTQGPAPQGLASTGSAICNGLWTLCGVPVVTLPLFRSSDGLPMGLQLVGRLGEDGQLLRTARWLWRQVRQPASPL